MVQFLQGFGYKPLVSQAFLGFLTHKKSHKKCQKRSHSKGFGRFWA